MPVLRALKGHINPREFVIEEERMVLGRDPAREIHLDFDNVSRKHAEFTCDGEHYFLTDLKSSNGTLLNGKRLLSHQPQCLCNGDKIKICDLIFTFLDGPDDPQIGSQDKDEDDSVVISDSGTETPSGISRMDMSSSSWLSRTSVNSEAKLKSIMEIVRDLHATIELERVLEKILDCLLRVFPEADRAIVIIQSGELRRPDPMVARYRHGSLSKSIVSRSVIDHVTQNLEAIISDDAQMDPRFEPSQSLSTSSVRSLMCAPLINRQSASLGIIQVDSLAAKKQFQESDLDMLVNVAMLVALAVENSMLHETALRERALQRDLEVAHEIQLGILPSGSPQIPGYEFFDFYSPARQVGGDYYDYIPLDDRRMAIVIADVAGKGVPAALVMAGLSSELKQLLARNLEIGEILSQLNTTLVNRHRDGRFITISIAVVDLVTSKVKVVNAGHWCPAHVQENGVVSEGDPKVGLPIGLLEDQTYEAHEFQLAIGESLVMFTDGIIDAQSPEEEMFGTKRLDAHVAQWKLSAMEMGRGIVDDLLEFVADANQTDDISLVVLKRVKIGNLRSTAPHVPITQANPESS